MSAVEDGERRFEDTDPVRTAQSEELVTNIQLGNELVIALLIFLLEIIEKASAIANHLDETISRTMVFLVPFQMFGQLLYPFGQKSNLYIRRPRITLVPLKLLLDSFLINVAH